MLSWKAWPAQNTLPNTPTIITWTHFTSNNNSFCSIRHWNWAWSIITMRRRRFARSSKVRQIIATATAKWHLSTDGTAPSASRRLWWWSLANGVYIYTAASATTSKYLTHGVTCELSRIASSSVTLWAINLFAIECTINFDICITPLNRSIYLFSISLVPLVHSFVSLNARYVLPCFHMNHRLIMHIYMHIAYIDNHIHYTHNYVRIAHTHSINKLIFHFDKLIDAVRARALAF